MSQYQAHSFVLLLRLLPAVQSSHLEKEISSLRNLSQNRDSGDEVTEGAEVVGQ
jgi:hypothetical protein